MGYITAKRLQSILFGVVIIGLAPNACWASAIKSVTISGPSSCTKKSTITISVTVRVNVGWNIKVTLYEDDVFFDDKIGTKTIRRKPGSTNWEETITFTFSPAKFEKGKTLEFYAKASGKKSNKITVRCR